MLAGLRSRASRPYGLPMAGCLRASRPSGSRCLGTHPSPAYWRFRLGCPRRGRNPPHWFDPSRHQDFRCRVYTGHWPPACRSLLSRPCRDWLPHGLPRKDLPR